MADVAIAIRSYLLTKSAVTTLIGSRIYTDIIEERATLPAVSMSKVSTQHEHDLSNLSGVAHCRLQFDCYANRAAGGRTTANDIAETIRATGICGIKGIYSSIDIRGVRLEEGQRNYVEYAQDASDDHRYVTTFDLMVDFTETI